jgi:hypothetical protein
VKEVPFRSVALRNESFLFEVKRSFSADFQVLRKARVVARLLTLNEIEPNSCQFTLRYLSGERNVLREQIQTARISNVSQVKRDSVPFRIFGLTTASTASLVLEDVSGAESVIVIFRRNNSSPIFVRRDTLRLEHSNKETAIFPHSILVTISDEEKPRYLARTGAGRRVFTSRACIGSKGVMFILRILDKYGERIPEGLSAVAHLASIDGGAIVIARARRLERPERFNKELDMPTGARFLVGNILPITGSTESLCDVSSFKISQFRHAVGFPVGVALFEQEALAIHKTALAQSQEAFLSLRHDE